MLRKVKSCLLALAFLMAVPSGLPEKSFAFNDIHLNLTQETRSEVSIAVVKFKPLKQGSDPAGLGKEGREILENDLRLSELFLPTHHSVFDALEQQGGNSPFVKFKEWNRLGVQWLITTRYYPARRADSLSFIFRLYDVVNQQFLVGKKYQGKKSQLRKMIHRFADEVVAQLTGKQGVAGTQMAYLTRAPGGKEIYAVDFDGFHPRKLTQENAIVLSPDWAPDGETLAYTSFADHNPDLIMFNPLKNRRRTLARLPGLNAAPAWSPSGTRIALVLSKDQNSEIYVMDRASRLTRLTRHYNIDTSPSWSPDGKRMAFTSDRSGTGRPQIYIMEVDKGDQSGVKRISFGSSYNDNPSWSPDGSKIAYTSLVGGVFQIKIYDLKARRSKVFTTGEGSKEEPTWSPDGQFIAYRNTVKNKPQIYIKRLGGKKSRQLTFLPTGGYSPDWSPYIKK